MHSISILFVFCRDEKPSIYYSVGAHAATTQCPRPSTSLYQVQRSLPCSFTFVDLTLANILQDWSTILRCKVLNFAPSIFSILPLLPTSEIYFAFVAVWDIFCFYIARYRIKLVISYHVLVLWVSDQKCQEPRYSSIMIIMITQSLDIREEHFRNHMLYSRPQIRAALTQPSFARLQCSHSRSCIPSEQH